MIDSQEHREKVKELKDRLQQWMKAQGDRKLIYNEPYPVGNPKPTAETIDN